MAARAPRGPKDHALRALLQRLLELSDEFGKEHVPESGSGTLRSEVQMLTYGYLQTARELLRGVVIERKDHNPANSLRLARHLFEQAVDLEYLLAHQEAALRQVNAREDRTVIALGTARGIALKDAKTRTERDAAATAMNRAAQRARSTREVHAAEWGRPTYATKAAAIGRSADYSFYYAMASWFSHPGMTTSRNAVFHDEAHDELGPTLGLQEFIRILERVNWVLGPLPGFRERLKVIDAHFAPPPTVDAPRQG